MRNIDYYYLVDLSRSRNRVCSPVSLVSFVVTTTSHEAHCINHFQKLDIFGRYWFHAAAFKQPSTCSQILLIQQCRGTNSIRNVVNFIASSLGFTLYEGCNIPSRPLGESLSPRLLIFRFEVIIDLLENIVFDKPSTYTVIHTCSRNRNGWCWLKAYKRFLFGRNGTCRLSINISLFTLLTDYDENNFWFH